MIPIIWMLIGILFLIIDTRITGLISYPKFIEFPTLADKTVDMVINHVVGDYLPIDIFSDIIGYIIFIVVCCMIVNKNKKAFRCFIFSIIALLAYCFNLFMPFFFNGEIRYNIASFSYIISILIECSALIEAGLVCTYAVETIEHHATNMACEIFFMISAFCGFIRGMAFFYDTPRVIILYYSLQVAAFIVFISMYAYICKTRLKS